MSPKVRLRNRMRILLDMAMAFIIVILLSQLWLFTVAIDGVEGAGGSSTTALIALPLSLVACLAICGLIRLFLRAEVHQ